MQIGLVRHFYTKDLNSQKEMADSVDHAADVLRDLGATVEEVELARFRNMQQLTG